MAKGARPASQAERGVGRLRRPTARVRSGQLPEASDRAARDGRALDDAIDNGYVVADGPDSLAPESWRGWCRDGGCPCVILYRAGRFAQVELDLAPAGWRLTDAGRSRIAAVLTGREMRAVRSPTVLYTAGVSLRKAEGFVAALLKLLADPTSTSAI